MLLKNVLVLILIFFMSVTSKIYADENETSVQIRQGTFLKVLVTEEFSSLSADIGDEICFLNLQDMYIYETNVVPANTKIYGEIEDVLEPVEGRDGAIKVLITKMITPDKKVYKIKGHIYSENDNYLGGKMTSSTYYRKVPHYSSSMRPFLQAAPLNVLEMGKHTVVKPGAELFVILENDVKINN